MVPRKSIRQYSKVVFVIVAVVLGSIVMEVRMKRIKHELVYRKLKFFQQNWTKKRQDLY